MELYPAVDVQDGRVARASGGAEDPVAVVRALARGGARWVHVVDLDRALGRGEQCALVRQILAQAPVPVQVGGGLCAEVAIGEMLSWGAARVVVGAEAAADDALLARLVARHGVERLAVGIDARDGKVAPRGAPAALDLTAGELATRARAAGVRTVVYTDVTRDGRLAGPDLDGACAIAALGLDVVASGGVAALDDLRRARAAGLAGVIVGRALHEGRFTLAEALACVA